MLAVSLCPTLSGWKISIMLALVDLPGSTKKTQTIIFLVKLMAEWLFISDVLLFLYSQIVYKRVSSSDWTMLTPNLVPFLLFPLTSLRSELLWVLLLYGMFITPLCREHRKKTLSTQVLSTLWTDQLRHVILWCSMCGLLCCDYFHSKSWMLLESTILDLIYALQPMCVHCKRSMKYTAVLELLSHEIQNCSSHYYYCIVYCHSQLNMWHQSSVSATSSSIYV